MKDTNNFYHLFQFIKTTLVYKINVCFENIAICNAKFNTFDDFLLYNFRFVTLLVKAYEIVVKT